MTIHCVCSRSLSSEDRMSGRSDDRLAQYKSRLQRKVMVQIGNNIVEISDLCYRAGAGAGAEAGLGAGPGAGRRAQPPARPGRPQQQRGAGARPRHRLPPEPSLPRPRVRPLLRPADLRARGLRPPLLLQGILYPIRGRVRGRALNEQ